MWLQIRCDVDPLIFFHIVSHNTDINKILKLSMCEKWILYTFVRGIVMYVYFEFTVPLQSYSQVFFMLIRIAVIIPHFC